MYCCETGRSSFEKIRSGGRTFARLARARSLIPLAAEISARLELLEIVFVAKVDPAFLGMLLPEHHRGGQQKKGENFL